MDRTEQEYYERLKNGGEMVYIADPITSPSNQSDDENNHISVPLSKPGRKTDKEREESGQRREWSDDEIIRLITLWRENDVLYNVDHPMYCVQSARKEAIDKMSDILDISVKDINDKMHSLRTYYGSQRQRRETAISRNPQAANTLPRWKFYEQMSFLYETVSMRAARNQNSTRSRRKRETQQFDEQMKLSEDRGPTMYRLCATSDRSESNEGIDEHAPTVYPYPIDDMPINKRRRVEQIDENIGTMNSSNMNPDELFSHMITCSISQIHDEQQKEYLKLQIQKLIYETRFSSKHAQ